MCPPGRKRRSGRREPNGRLARVKAAERRALVGERDQVSHQPHRRGDLDQKLESPLGRLRPELYDSGIEYGRLARHFFRAKGIQLEIDEGHQSTVAGVSEVTTRWLCKEIARIEEPLKKLNRAGFDGVRRLAVFEMDALPGTELSTSKVLYRLALMLRNLEGGTAAVSSAGARMAR